MKRIIQLSLGVALLAFLIWLVDPSVLLTTVRTLTVEAIVLLLLISVALVILSAIKWSCFISALGAEVSIWRLINLYMVGYFVNTLLPSWIGGDVVRSWYIGRRIGHHDAAAATILERYTGLLAMICLAFVAMWFSPLVTWQIKSAVGVVMAGLVFLTVLVQSLVLIRFVARVPGGAALGPSIAKVQSAFKLVRGRSGLLFTTLALSFLFHLIAVLNTAVAAWAVGWVNVPLIELCVVVPLILIVGAIPVAPAGLGIQEGAFYFFLTGIGATPAQALMVGLVLRAKTYLLGVIGWFSWQYERRYNREFVSEALRDAGVTTH